MNTPASPPLDLAMEDLEAIDAPFSIGDFVVGVGVGLGVGALVFLT